MKPSQREKHWGKQTQNGEVSCLKKIGTCSCLATKTYFLMAVKQLKNFHVLPSKVILHLVQKDLRKREGFLREWKYFSQCACGQQKWCQFFISMQHEKLAMLRWIGTKSHYIIGVPIWGGRWLNASTLVPKETREMQDF